MANNNALPPDVRALPPLTDCAAMTLEELNAMANQAWSAVKTGLISQQDYDQRNKVIWAVWNLRLAEQAVAKYRAELAALLPPAPSSAGAAEPGNATTWTGEQPLIARYAVDQRYLDATPGSTRLLAGFDTEDEAVKFTLEMTIDESKFYLAVYDREQGRDVFAVGGGFMVGDDPAAVARKADKPTATPPGGSEGA